VDDVLLFARKQDRYLSGKNQCESLTIDKFVARHVAPGSTIYADGLNIFATLAEAGYKHVARAQPHRTELGKGARSVVRLADRAIGNLQQWLTGTHHGVSRDQFQVYLDEFVFRYNRRRTPMAAFQTLVGLGTQHAPTLGAQIRSANDLRRAPGDHQHKI
jgi:transposase-like protein